MARFSAVSHIFMACLLAIVGSLGRRRPAIWDTKNDSSSQVRIIGHSSSLFGLMSKKNVPFFGLLAVTLTILSRLSLLRKLC